MRVTALISTYNGEKFLRQQLDSLLAQQLPPNAQLNILVRDDGSTDATLDILEEYSKKYEDVISYYKGENLKPAKSFLHLLKNCPYSDYYAFCDQDDVWNPDKIAIAINALQAEANQDIPLLYCSNVMVSDAELNPIGVMNSSKMYADFAHVLIYVLSNGCTQVFNNHARDELINYDMDKNLVIMHDRLAELIIAILGKIIYDENPTMLYRQHGNNVVGEQSIGRLRSFFKRVKRFFGSSNSIRSDRCRMFLELYGDRLNDKQRRLLYAVGYYKTDKNARKTLMKDKAFSKNRNADFWFRWAVRLKKL